MIKQKIKSFVKFSLGKCLKASDKKILKLLDNAEVISFDIFDTLVKRNVNEPKDVHKLVYKEFYKETGINLAEYPKFRVKAEKDARKVSSKEEISLEDIFSKSNEILDTYKKELQRIEEKTEIEVCCPNLRIKRFYEKALKNNKCIIITSDMYLEETIIKKILNKCGYDNYDNLYLSSKENLCKSTGNIYEKIKNDYQLGQIMHIGDNFKGDYLMAKRKKIKACLIERQEKNLKYWKKNSFKEFDYERIYSFINNHICVSCNEAERIGYEVLGPILFGFCQWLNTQVKSDGVDKIFFLSREGKILQEAFEILYPESELEKKYLYVSRQALLVPLIADTANFDEMIDIIKCFLQIPLLKTIRVACSLNQTQFCEALRENGMSEETKIYEVPNEKKKIVFDIVKKLGNKQFAEQKTYITRYLRENSFIGNVAIVDIGWLGSMQRALQKHMAGTDVKICGYYLGVRNMEKEDFYKEMLRKGYLFEPHKNEDFNLMARFTTEIFELLFLNKAGSLLLYDTKEGRIVPVLADSEYGKKESKFIDSMQTAALNFVHDISEESNLKESVTMQVKYSMKAYSDFAVYPSMATLHIFKDFNFLNVSVKKLLPEHSVFYYLLHIKQLKKDLNESLCKIFFVKKLLKIKFPYFELFKLLATKMKVKSNYRKKFYGERI